MSFTPRTYDSEYQAGATIRSLAAKYQLSQYWIRKGISEPRPQGNRRHHFVDEHVFDCVTDVSAYWAGFLLADGCLLDSYRGQVVVSVTSADREHVGKFRVFVKGTYPLTKHGRSWQLKFPSDWMAAKLASYGVVPRKSGQEAASPILQENRHFWRGVIDGDGCLTTKKDKIRGYLYPNITLCGSRRLCEQFKVFIHTDVSVTKYKRVNCHRITISRSTEAVHVARLLYAKASVALERKAAIAQTWFKEIV